MSIVGRFIFSLLLLCACLTTHAQSNVSVATAKVIDSFPHIETDVNTDNGGLANGMIGSCRYLPCCKVLVYKVVLPYDGSLRVSSDNYVNFSGGIIAYTPISANPTDWSDLLYYQYFSNTCGFRDTLQLGHGYQWPVYNPASPNAGNYYDVSKAVSAGEYYILYFNQNQQINTGSDPSANLTFEFARACPDRNGVLDTTICAGESLTINGTIYDSTIMGAVEVINNNGLQDCDSTLTINLTVLPEIRATRNDTICEGDSLVINGTVYRNTVLGASEVFENAGTFGCDSSLTINLIVLASRGSTIEEILCAGESITVNGTTYDQTVIGAQEWFPSNNPALCDSLVVINLSVLPAARDTLRYDLCAGEGVVINGSYFDYSVNGAEVIIPEAAPQGCDSILILYISLADSIDASISQSGATMRVNTDEASYQWLDCFGGLGAVPGATNQSFTPTQNGEYAVEIIKGDCIDTSDCVSVLTVGLEAPSVNASLLQVHPNPSRGLIEVHWEGVFVPGAKLDVYSIDQKHWGSYVLDRPRRTLDLSDLPAGVYLLRYQEQIIKIVLDRGS